MTLEQMSFYLIFALTFLGVAITLALNAGNYGVALVCGLVVVNVALLGYRAQQQEPPNKQG